MVSGTADRAGTPSPGDRVHRYEVQKLLWRETHTSLYVASDPELDRQVVLNITNPEAPPEFAAAFLAGAQVLAQLSHPNVAAVHDFGRVGDAVFCARAFVDGAPLQSSQARTTRTLARFFSGLAGGLNALASHGAGHGDLGPSRVLIDSNGRCQIVDFGTTTASPDCPFAAPEVREGTVATQHSDQYSLCLLAASWWGRVDPELLVRDGELQTKELRAALRGIPARVARAIERGLESDPNDRHPDLATLAVVFASARPRRLPSLVAIGLAITAVLGVVWVATPRPKGASYCAEAPSRRAQLWNNKSATLLIQTFARTGLPYAEHTARTAGKILDLRAATWDVEVERVCAAQQKGEQLANVPREMYCLQETLGELATTVELLTTASESAVLKAVQIAESTRSARTCKDTQSPLPPVAIRLAVAEIEQRLRRGQRLGAQGEYEQASQVLEVCLKDAKALAYPPTILRATAHMAVALRNLDDKRSGPMMHKSFSLALAQGDRKLVARMAFQIAGHNIKARRYNEALHWLENGAAVTHELNLDPTQVSYAFSNSEEHRLRGVLASAQGNYGAAVEHFITAVAVHKRAGADRRIDIHLVNLAQAQADAGDLTAAVDHYRQALALISQRLGPQHPLVATNQLGLAVVLDTLGKPDESLRLAQSALTTYRAVYGNESVKVGDAWLSVAGALSNAGRYDEALASHLRSLKVYRAATKPKSFRISLALSNIATLQTSRGLEPTAALAGFDTALENLSELLGVEHPVVLSVRRSRLPALLAVGHTADALRQADDVLAKTTAAVGPEHPDLVYVLEYRAEALASLQQADAAIVALERALALCEVNSLEPARYVRPQLALAALYEQIGDPRAQRLRASALRVIESGNRTALDSQMSFEVGQARIRRALASL